MLGHASAAITLDEYADLFDEDLDAVAVELNKAANEAVAGRVLTRNRTGVRSGARPGLTEPPDLQRFP